MYIGDAIELLPAPARLTRAQYEWLRDEAPFPSRYPRGLFKIGAPDSESGYAMSIPRGALLVHTRMHFVCRACDIVWHIDDLEGRLTRHVRCPLCDEPRRSHIGYHCVQAYRTKAAYTEAREHIMREAEMWNSVDVLEQKKQYNPYERMAQRRTAAMRRDERRLRGGT